MAKVYSSIKGAQGVAPGVIVPFSKEVQNSNQQRDRVPGGYLRCDGTVSVSYTHLTLPTKRIV